MPTRRSFVRAASGAALGGLALPRISYAATDTGILEGYGTGKSSDQIAQDEAYWEVVQRAYSQDAGFINLESGFFSPAPDAVVDAHD